MMADSPKTTKVGTRVEVIGKGHIGTVAYVGTTLFSNGKWIGVVLDEPVGKNNGTVQGKTYFSCPDGHGIFVRQSQITPIEGVGDSRSVPPDIPAKPPGIPSAGGDGRTHLPRKSGIRPPSYVGKSTENIAESGVPTPNPKKEAASKVSPTSTPTPAKSRLPRSKEATPVDDRASEPTATPAKPQSKMPVHASQPKKASSKTDLSAKSSSKDNLSEKSSSKTDLSSGQQMSSWTNPATMSKSMDEMSLHQQQEMVGLNAEIKDLNEKLETLKFKRAEDKIKLKEFEKVKIQLQQLQEYKSKMTEMHSDLQKQLLAVKNEKKEIMEAFDGYREEMSDVSEMIEIATLDKEMAEEKTEGLQAEVDALKEKVEEITLDLEILRSEISEKGTEGVAASFEQKQLEQQNERLKDALIKLRDLTNQEKHDAAKLSKQNEKLVTELTALKKDKDNLQTQVTELQNQIFELKEQVDSALGAEEMVEKLTERNLELEDKLAELREENSVLEALNEMNEEMQENARETELELREEVDLANVKVTEIQRKLEASLETIADYEKTINKFRELVAHLQETNRELMSKQQESDQKAQSTPSLEMFDFKMKFAETKAYAKTIDMELRKLEVQQVTAHVQLLLSFMPDSFMKRGGDHDAINVLLMVPRVINKAELLSSQIKDKFDVVDRIEREDVLKSHKGDQCSFANQMILLVNTLQSVMRQYESALQTCSVELFTKVGTLVPEMSAHEKSIDYYIDLLRKDQLDETVSLDLLEKSISFFQQLYSVHLVNEKVDCTSLMADQVRLVLSACDCITTDITRLKILLMPGQEQSEFSILLRDLETCNNDTRMCARKIKRRLPQEGSAIVTPLKFVKEIQDLLLDSSRNITNVSKTLALVAHGAMQQASIMTEAHPNKEFSDAEGLMPKKMEELAYQAVDKIYSKEDNGPYECLRLSFGTVVGTMNQLANAMENGEYDFDGTHDKKIVAPVRQRANTVKAQIADTEVMKYKLDNKEEAIMDLKKQLKLKQEEISEQQVRISLLERKFENATRGSNEQVDKMKRKLDDAMIQFKKKEKELEDTLDVLQGDIDVLEREKLELKERLKVLSKKTLLEGLTRQSSGMSAKSKKKATSPSGSFSGVFPGTPSQESPLLLQQNECLREALRVVKNENIRLTADKLKKTMASLPPLKVPKKPVGLASPTGLVSVGQLPDSTLGKNEINILLKKTSTLLADANKLSACCRVIDISKKKPGVKPTTENTGPAKQLVEQTASLVSLNKQIQEVQVQITTLLASHRPGGQVRTDFATFPTPQFAKVLHEKGGDSQLIGRVSVPVPGQNEVIPVSVTKDLLRQIHLKLSM
ncbi:dynactin subunit 1-like isoform X2 [Gigantopelta aegis]|uniref:dynactin subunit 1-like isoform X2 n=1 Tax=Gigantopelta aegis TaxID=1735272 RepID=UPI001B88CF15|nr:dynactin subunit 1-like isoform X2 [Gigantopelta aegis]